MTFTGPQRGLIAGEQSACKQIDQDRRSSQFFITFMELIFVVLLKR